MYTLISAIAKPKSGSGRWTAVSIGQTPVSSLYTQYSKITAVLSNPFLPAPVSLDLELIRGTYGGQSITFNELLVSLDNLALPTSITIPAILPKYARYADALRAGYKLTPIHPTISVTTELPLSEKTNLLLTKPGVNYATFYKSVMVSINGFFHLTDANAGGVRVVDAMRTKNKANQNHVGLLSFRDIGHLTFKRITPQMIYKQRPEQLLQHRCYVDLGEDVSNKSVMLVLGGYLHVLDRKTFYRVGKSQFAIDFGNLPYLERFYESEKSLDLSSLLLAGTPLNPHQVSVGQLLSDEVITRYLGLTQSFFVIVDTPELFAERAPVMSGGFVDTYIARETPLYPLIAGLGKISEYWATYEDHQWNLAVRGAAVDQRVFDTVIPRTLNSVSDSRLTTDPFRLSTAHFLKIGKDL
jgi:hypothetical protein